MADLFGNPFSSLSGGSIGDQPSTRSSFGPSNVPTGFIGQPFSGGSIGDQASNNSGFGFFPVFNNTPGGGNAQNPFLVNQAGAGQLSANTGGNPFALRPSALSGRSTAFGRQAFDPFGDGFGAGGGDGQGGATDQPGTAESPDFGSFATSVSNALGMATGVGAAGVLGKAGFEAVTGKPFGLEAITDILGFGGDGVDIGPTSPAHDVGLDDFGNDDTGNGGGGNGPEGGGAVGADSTGSGSDDTGVGGGDTGPGDDGDGDCVIATHAVAAGSFTRRDKASAVVWCRRHLHDNIIGEAFRRGYRWHGNRAIERGKADQHYDEFRRFVAFVTGKDRTLRGAWIVAKRAVQFTLTGLFVR